MSGFEFVFSLFGLLFIVKFAAVAVPPLSLITCLMMISWGWISSFVTVQVLVSPLVMDPEQSAEKEAL